MALGQDVDVAVDVAVVGRRLENQTRTILGHRVALIRSCNSCVSVCVDVR